MEYSEYKEKIDRIIDKGPPINPIECEDCGHDFTYCGCGTAYEIARIVKIRYLRKNKIPPFN